MTYEEDHLLAWALEKRDRCVAKANDQETISEEEYWCARASAFREMIWHLRSCEAKDGKPKPKGGR